VRQQTLEAVGVLLRYGEASAIDTTLQPLAQCSMDQVGVLGLHSLITNEETVELVYFIPSATILQGE
jgi:hypothetical protein